MSNNVYKIDNEAFPLDIKNMVFKMGFELYINVNSLKIEVTYKLGKILNVSCSNNLNIKSIHFNHYHYNGDDFFLGRYNFHSTREFESEILRQIYQYYTSKIDFDCHYILNRLRYRDCHKNLIKKIIYKSDCLLKKNGILAIEIGYNQYSKVNKLLKYNRYREVSKEFDYNNNVRCIITTKM